MESRMPTLLYYQVIVTGNIYFGDRIGEKQVLLILEFLSQLDRDTVAHIPNCCRPAE